MKIIDRIRDHGIEATAEKFSLTVKRYPDKILLKYSQIDSPMNYEEVQECRGLILTTDGLNVISYPFKKFFNHGEVNAASIDFDNSVCLEKLDGTFINVYYHNNKWNISTTGMAEAEGPVSDMENYSFADLFKDTIKKCLSVTFDEFTERLNENISYFFELTTPYNIVVTNHTESKVTLIGSRNNINLLEAYYSDLLMIGEEIGVDVVKATPFKDLSTIIGSFDNMGFEDEGYVVLDNNFNRIKLKNPKYVSVHHTKSRTPLHHIMDVIKNNEVDEFISVFKERADEIKTLKDNFDNLVIKLQRVWSEELSKSVPSLDDKEAKKNFALLNHSVTNKYGIERFRGLFFNMSTGKVRSPYDALILMDNKELYQLLRS